MAAFSAGVSKSTRKSRFSRFVAAYSAGHYLLISMRLENEFVAAYSAGHNQHTKNNCIKSTLKNEILLNTIINPTQLLKLYFNNLLST
ncbi:hypothetical protein GCM10009193_25810 [Shewanella aestuarii]|nr:hypothetical protein GCM10009193_25810 [Shewanella aestuarii]